MSLKTKIKGFTAWINFRLTPYGSNLSNILTELFKGFHIQQLLHSLTSKSLKNLKSFDGLTEQQRITRIHWLIEELKKSRILPQDSDVNCRLVALQSQPHVGDKSISKASIKKEVFDLLWKLVSNDIWFLWQRLEFLDQEDDSIMTSAVFKWTPDPPPKKKKRIYLTEEAVLGGGAAASSPEEPQIEEYDMFPGNEKMLLYKSDPPPETEDFPRPRDCIIEMINLQLQKVSEGRNIEVDTLEDLTNARVLCGLVNSFVPGTFTTEILLDDRWTINLVLKTVEKMLNFPNSVKCEDICENNEKSICAYMIAFFTLFYHYKQSCAAVNRYKELNLLIQDIQHEMEQMKERGLMTEHLKIQLDLCVEERMFIKKNYEIDNIAEWIEEVQKIQSETLKTVSSKIKDRFNTIKVPRNMTVNDLMTSSAVNLQLTNDSCFLLKDEKQSTYPDKKFVLKRIVDDTYLDNFTQSEHSTNLHKLLNIPCYDVTTVDPLQHPEYQFYFECKSLNKTLKAGSTLLYQIFPGNLEKWKRLLIKSIQENDFELVQKLIIFFNIFHPSLIHMQIHPTGNSLLHVAARYGNFEICKYLLRNGCDVNARNKSGMTSLFVAAVHLHKNICQLLIEWGIEVEVENFKNEKALSLMRHENMRENLQHIGDNWKEYVPQLINNDDEALMKIIAQHLNKEEEMVDLESRCICGSTLLHTAVHFANMSAIKNLLKLRVDINLQDFQSATPLHRAKNLQVLKLLLDSNAEVNAVDKDGNSSLHVRCYGEKGKESFLEGILMLITYGCDVVKRNKSDFMPIHCAAIQGRGDVIELLITGHEEEIKNEINKESSDHPPSLPYLAFSSNYLDSAKWLIEKGFNLKEGESDQLLYRILSQQITIDKTEEGVQLLLQNKASMNLSYTNGDSIIHLAVRMDDCYDVIQILIDSGAPCDVTNSRGQTPLFDCVKSNSFQLFRLLVSKGADVRRHDKEGLTCFDFVHDYDEWLAFPLFSPEVIDRLKVYRLKRSRDVVKKISRKIETSQHQRNHPPVTTTVVNIRQKFVEKSPPRLSRQQLRILSARMNIDGGDHANRQHRPQLMMTSAMIT